jgi:hypothetical protein
MTSEDHASELKARIDKILTKSQSFIRQSPISGVYLLYDGQDVVYVGQSMNVHQRILQHGDKHFDSYRVIECAEAHLGSFERFMINYFLPRYNQDGTTRSISEYHYGNLVMSSGMKSILFPEERSGDNPFDEMINREGKAL